MNTTPTTLTVPTTPAILKTLIGPAQRAALWAALEGEEREHFADIVTRLVATWQAMPATSSPNAAADPTGGPAWPPSPLSTNALTN